MVQDDREAAKTHGSSPAAAREAGDELRRVAGLNRVRAEVADPVRVEKKRGTGEGEDDSEEHSKFKSK
nr:hypothetical protein Iba_chr12eCG16240 [Ipomoea batatas]